MVLFKALNLIYGILRALRCQIWTLEGNSEGHFFRIQKHRNKCRASPNPSPRSPASFKATKQAFLRYSTASNCPQGEDYAFRDLTSGSSMPFPLSRTHEMLQIRVQVKVSVHRRDKFSNLVLAGHVHLLRDLHGVLRRRRLWRLRRRVGHLPLFTS